MHMKIKKRLETMEPSNTKNKTHISLKDINKYVEMFNIDKDKAVIDIITEHVEDRTIYHLNICDEKRLVQILYIYELKDDRLYDAGGSTTKIS